MSAFAKGDRVEVDRISSLLGTPLPRPWRGEVTAVARSGHVLSVRPDGHARSLRIPAFWAERLVPAEADLPGGVPGVFAPAEISGDLDGLEAGIAEGREQLDEMQAILDGIRAKVGL